ncbi:hypothetical protein [Synechococcus elongatus]|uniref:hypothetical protein n=1 Tax=Synechococcus elongatus TaxID=32046 RepID=UPI000F7EBCA5|nr:hypothetical protein [Synechococcus elongatus]MBD2587567.1 hypothetical protein [Synechococcus elongatus FACHB-242]MBD2688654.1 hypothetical protein [Synechococcus elongatus FACHB-1061]MBD2707725.1 hypothetical protein [Synechococcus elongatus PCC 7942 = FACHB-805]UOW70944.1 Ebf2 [Synechococcus elongatus PCC 7943]UOW73665.1 Ebf2 [Synechococcus elongatus PCC 6311]
MSKLINTIDDNHAQSLVGGSGYSIPTYPKHPYPNYYGKPSSSVQQSVSAPITSIAGSSSNALAFNIGSFNLASPQIAKATAVSSATSLVYGGTVSA